MSRSHTHTNTLIFFSSVDYSDWARNEDYLPNRGTAQAEAASMYIETIGEKNPENIFAGVSMGGGEKFSKVLSSLTLKDQQVTSALYKIEPSGTIDVMNALKIASLILKNREQKHYHQRIVLFVASPIRDAETLDSYRAMGAQLKRSGVSLDVVSIGEIGENSDKLHALYDGAKVNDDENHFVTLGPGMGTLTDVLLCSPMIQGSSTTTTAAAATAASASMGGAGIDGMDSDLIRALRESEIEYDRELQKALQASMMDYNAQNKANSSASDKTTTSSTNATTTTTTTTTTTSPPPPPATTTSNKHDDDDDDDDIDMDEDEELRKALEMSLMDVEKSEQTTAVPPSSEPKKEEEKKDDEKKKGLDDIDPTTLIDNPNFVNSILSELDGVDPEEAKKHLKEDEEEDEDGKDKKDAKKK